MTQGVVLHRSDELASRVESIVRALVDGLAAALGPAAELHHIGATAIPGALTKGDVDVLVRVPADAFAAAVAALRAEFAVRQPENWTATFASFGDDRRHALPVGVQLVVRDSDDDFLLFLRDHLIGNPAVLAEYNRLKLAHAGGGAQPYWHAKHEFFSRILAARAGSARPGHDRDS